MTQEQQDKAAFYGQHIGCELGNRRMFTDDQYLTLGNFSMVVRFSGKPLLLKSLSDITDEDAIEIGRMIWPYVDKVKTLICNDYVIIRSTLGGINLWFDCEIIAEVDEDNNEPDGYNSLFILAVFDFLRSRGYLIPFRNYSTDQILEMGWAKLKKA